MKNFVLFFSQLSFFFVQGENMVDIENMKYDYEQAILKLKAQLQPATPSSLFFSSVLFSRKKNRFVSFQKEKNENFDKDFSSVVIFFLSNFLNFVE